MDFPFYEKKINDADGIEKDTEITLARKYRPDEDLVSAVNVAMLLKQPLILTGEPGTGKTQLAFNLSWQLHLKDKDKFKSKKPFIFETKSTSTARDLFYTYDTVGRFHAAQIAQLEGQTPPVKKSGSAEDSGATKGAKSAEKTNHSEDSQTAVYKKRQSAEDFITYNAFGAAILFAQDKEKPADVFPPDILERDDESDEKKAERLRETGWLRRSVVLIDEIDKAPRDFPNDILNEIEKLYFRIPELNGKQIKADNEEYRPVIILTSNSEKNLPDAFLRRCIYYHIKFPESTRMKEIVQSHLQAANSSSKKKDDGNDSGSSEAGIDQALDLFYKFRDADRNLRKTPATAEFISWLRVMQQLAQKSNHEVSLDNLKSYAGWKMLIRPTLGVLFKFREDFRTAKEIINLWEPKTEANKQ